MSTAVCNHNGYIEGDLHISIESFLKFPPGFFCVQAIAESAMQMYRFAGCEKIVKSASIAK